MVRAPANEKTRLVEVKAIHQSLFFALMQAVPRRSSDSQSHGKQASGSIAARSACKTVTGIRGPGWPSQRAQNEDIKRGSLRCHGPKRTSRAPPTTSHKDAISSSCCSTKKATASCHWRAHGDAPGGTARLSPRWHSNGAKVVVPNTTPSNSQGAFGDAPTLHVTTGHSQGKACQDMEWNDTA